MRVRSLILSVTLLAVAMPVRAQRSVTVDAAANAPRRGVLAGVGPFARFTPRTEMVSEATVQFIPGQSELTVKSRVLLDDLAGQVQRDATMRVVIVRPAGVAGMALALATQRADVTRAYLTARGVAAYRISMAARGGKVGDSAPNQKGEELTITISADPEATQP